jgi:uncharacterized SAM-binding protein YcdF (DUF218 family)
MALFDFITATTPHPVLRRTARACLAFIFAFALWLLGLVGFMRDVHFPVYSDIQKLEAQDAIVVLTGGTRRLAVGFDLLDKKLGKKLFISGVYRGVDVEELMRYWKKDMTSAPDARVVLGFDAENTVGNAKETAAWIEGEGYDSIFLVTANYHMKRAVLDFRRHTPDTVIVPYPVAPENLDLANWWRVPSARRLIIVEYNKYLFTVALNLITGSALS